MEIPDPRQVYSGAQPRGAAAGDESDDEVRHQVYSGDRSDIEVVASSSTMPEPSMIDRDAMSSSTMDIEDEVSRRSIEVAVVHHSPAIGHGRSDTMCSEVTTSEYQGLPTTSQQRYDLTHRGEASSKDSRQSDSETSGIMYHRRTRAQDTGVHRSGEQRRSFEDLRAELTEELRFQQAMFLSARDELAARQDEMFTQTQVAIEGLRSNQADAPNANDNRRVQSPSTQRGWWCQGSISIAR